MRVPPSDGSEPTRHRSGLSQGQVDRTVPVLESDASSDL